MGQDRQMQMVEGNGGNQFRQYDGQDARNQNGYNVVQNVENQDARNQNGYNVVQNVENQNSNRDGNLVAARAEGNATGHNGNQIRCYNCRELAEEFDLMATATDLNEIEEVNANCILMANLQQASTSGTQTDKDPVYDSDGSTEVHNGDNCYDNEIFNMFTQEEQYTELLEPIPEPHQVPQNDNNIISEVSSVEQSGGTVEKHPTNVEETRVLYDSLYNNLAIEVEKVNTVNRKLRETNAELTTELARYKNQEKCFEIRQENMINWKDVIKTLELMLPRSLKKNTKCVNATDDAKLKLKLFMKSVAAAGSSEEITNHLNGDSPVPSRIVKDVSQPVAPTTAEQRLARKNELKARGTLLIALPDKHQLKFNSYKDAKTPMEAIEKRFGGNTKTKKVQKTILKQQFENFTGSSSEVKQSSSSSTATQNLAFVSSTSTDSSTNSVSAAGSVSAACVKLFASPLPNVDSLSNAVIYSFFASQSTSPQFVNEDLKQIDVDDLKEMVLRWQMAMLTMRTRRVILLGSVCLSRIKEGLVQLSHKEGLSQLRPQPQMPWSLNVMVLEAMIGAIKQKRSLQTFLLWLFHQTHKAYLLIMRQKLEKAKQEKDDLKLKLEKFQTSSKNLTALLASQTSEKARFIPSGGYHDVPPPYTRTFMPPKLDLVFNTAPILVKTDHLAFNVQHSPTNPEQALSHTSRPSAPIIEDWPIETTFQVATPVPSSPKSNSSGKKRNRKACFVCKSVDHLIKDCDLQAKKMAKPAQRNYANRGYHKQYALKPLKHSVPTAVLTQSKPVSNTAVRPVSVVLPYIPLTRPRHANQVVTKSKSPIRRQLTCNPSSRTSNSPLRINVVQVLVVSAAQGKQGTWVWRPKCPVLDHDFRTTSASMTLKRFNYNDALRRSNVSQMYDKKNSVLFTDTECPVLSSDFKLPDESQVLLRAPRENNMYNVNLKNIIPSGDLTCLFAKAILDESNVWYRRLAYVNFKTLNKLVKGNLVRGLPTKVFENDHTCVACKKGKQHRASCKSKPVCSVDQPLFRLHMDLFGPTFVKSLSKFQRKVDEGFLVGYSVCSKAFRVFNSRTRIIQETLHVNFLENKPNVAGTGPTWLFDIDSLSGTMNYHPITAGNQTNSGAGFQDTLDVEKAAKEVDLSYMLFPVWSTVGSTNPQNNAEDAAFDEKEHDFDVQKPESKVILSLSGSAQSIDQDDKTMKEAKGKSPIEFVTGYRDLNAEFQDCSENSSNEVLTTSTIVPTVGQNTLNSTNTFSVADMPGLEDIIYSDDEDVVGVEANFNNLEPSIPVSPIPTTSIHKDHHISQIIGDLSSTTQTRSVTRAVTDQAYASFMGFMVYQMDVKTFLYGTIEEEVYVCQPLGFEDPDHSDKVYKVVKALYGLHQASRAWYETLATYLLENGFQRGTIDQTLFIKKLKGHILLVQIYVKQKEDGIFISQDKSIAEILRKFGLIEDKLASTPIDTEKPLLKDPDGEDVDVHIYSNPKSFTPSCSKANL
nr:putative ribonuclease H-like domain-containing protein [Tanacetum cinerariifolium]